MNNKTKVGDNGQSFSCKIDNILKKKKTQLIIKRLFDISVSAIGIIILSPVFLIVAVAIKKDSVGPVFYRQVRVGKDGKEFRIFKFRTMAVDADKQGMQITIDGDRRITKPGNFLRKYKIDELPQLINVFIGNMSFVGPRPEVPKYIAIYNEEQRNILKVRPGITDNASIEYRNENTLLSKSEDPERTYIEEIMPKKIELNFVYLNNISVLYDIRLILKTIKLVIS